MKYRKGLENIQVNILSRREDLNLEEEKTRAIILKVWDNESFRYSQEK